MREFRWLQDSGQLESLAVCLRSLCGLRGAPPAYDDLVAALGLGSLVVADSRHSLRDWPELARDESLVATAEQLGVRLRDLHPRRAAVGLETSAEFALHFIDSYSPLIERALSCGQVALVWRGWPAPNDMQWGVITSDSAGQLRGHTLDQSAATVELTAPAQQVYIVEEIGPPASTRSAGDEFARAAWLLQAQERQEWGSDRALRTGSHAWREWAAYLSQAAPTAELLELHRAAASPVAAAREALGRWLRDLAGNLPADARSSAAMWSDACARAAQHLRESVAPTAAPDLSNWQAKSVQTLLELAALEARTAAGLAPHGRAIGVRPAYEPDALQV